MSQHRPNGTDAPPAQDAPVLKQWLPSRHVLLLRGVRVGVVLGGLMVLVLGLWEIGFPHTPAGRRQILHWAHYLTLGIAIVLGAGVLLAPGGRAGLRRYGPELVISVATALVLLLTRGMAGAYALRLYMLLLSLLQLGRLMVRITDVRMHPAVLVLGMFGLMIGVGMGLLMLPEATVQAEAMPFVDALFTATSAVCVTGLVVVPTGEYFTLFGQGIILTLIQLGGLGVISSATAVAVLFGGGGRGLGLQMTLQDIQDMQTLSEVKRTLRQILFVTFGIELAGGVLMFFALDLPFPTTIDKAYFCLFHTISAFCNAGFTTRPASLAGTPADDLGLNLVFMVLIVLGGVGFVVLRETYVRLRGRKRGLDHYGLQTRLVWIVTLILIGMGALGFLLLEQGASLANAPAIDGWPDALLASFFQSVTARTAGFNTVDTGALSAAGSMLIIVLMFIGASPGSTGGGLKTTNFAVLVLFARAQLAGKDRVDLFGRTLTPRTVQRAVMMLVCGVAVVAGSTLLLAALEETPFVDVFFEAVSAFATVGLSRGLTGELSTGGRLVVIANMYVGRVGLLALAIYLASRVSPPHYRYPEETVMAA